MINRVCRIACLGLLLAALLLPTACMGQRSNLFLFVSLGGLVGAVGTVVGLSFVRSEKLKLAVPCMLIVGFVLIVLSLCYLLGMLDPLSRVLPSHWSLFYPFLGRSVLCLAGVVIFSCSVLIFGGSRLVPCCIEGSGKGCLLAAVLVCFVWGLSFEGFWLPVWFDLDESTPLYWLVPVVFAVVLYSLSLVLASRLAGRFGAVGGSSLLTAFVSVGVAFFAAGQLTWGVFNRVFGFSSWSLELSLLSFVAILLADALVAYFIYQFDVERLSVSFGLDPLYGESACMEAPCRADRIEGESRLFSHLVEEFGFSDREAQAVALMIDGVNSDDSAKGMGVKPSTVRTYLQRAYKKLDVKDADGFRGKLTDLSFLQDDLGGETREFEVAVGVPGLGVASSRRLPGFLSKLFAFSICLMAGLVLVPHISFFGDSAWAASQAFSSFVGLVLALSGGLAATLPYLGLRPKPVSFLMREMQQCSNASLGILFACAALFLFASLLSIWLWVIMLAVDFVLLAACSWALSKAVNGQESGETQPAPPSSPGTAGSGLHCAALLVLFATCGFVIEDAWRPATDDFTWWIQTALLVVMIAYLAYRGAGIRLVGFLALASVACVVVFSCGVRVVLVAMFVVSWIALVLGGRSCATTRAFPLYVAAFGVAMVFGRWVTDAWWDQMSYGYVSAAAHGGFWLVGTLVPAVGLLLAALTLLSLGYLVVSERISSRIGAFQVDESAAALYFESRGLTPLESAVMTGIVRGKSGSRTAQELRYALGTVNSARWSAYRKLGVHDRESLLGLLEANGFRS